jgi:nucleoside transporter
MCIISPFAGGQLADRYFSTQRVLGVLHIVGGACLLFMGRHTSFQYIMLFMLVYSIVYTPTLALTNSICFHHMADSERDFGKIRVWGTIGWIVVGWTLSLFRNYLPAIKGDCLMLSGIAAAGMGVFCFFLPNTPPKKGSESPWAFLKAFALFKDKSFVIFMAISFVVVTELQFYYLLTAPFLQDIGVKAANVPAWMTLAQLAEILTMAWALPVLLPKTGVRWALAIGVIAWPIRYIVFAIGAPMWLVIASLTLHGVCYVFFFTVGQIYVNSVAPADIRASAQSLLAVITLGVGSFIGMHFAGFIKGFFTGPAGPNYTAIFTVPCVLTIACAAAFLIWFRPGRAGAQAAPQT